MPAEGRRAIVVGVVGGNGRERDLGVPTLEDPKFDVFSTEDLNDWEYPTLARVWQEARDSRTAFLCCCMHTKGASMTDTPKQRAANAWRLHTEYFNIERGRTASGSTEVRGIMASVRSALPSSVGVRMTPAEYRTRPTK